MIKIIVAAAIALSFTAAALVAPAGAQSPPLKTAAEKATLEASFSSATKIFVLEAAGDDLLGIESSKLALDAGEDRTKAFAKKMVSDHTRMAKELEGIVNGKAAFSVPSSLDDVHLGKIGKIKDLTGPEFTKAYLTLQVSLHQEAVARFERYRQDGDNAELKAFADRHLVQLRADGQMAQKLLDEK